MPDQDIILFIELNGKALETRLAGPKQPNGITLAFLEHGTYGGEACRLVSMSSEEAYIPRWIQ